MTASGDGKAECASHTGPGRGNVIFFSHRWLVAHLEEKGSTQDSVENSEAGDALGGDMWTWRREVDSEEMWIQKRKAHLEDMEAMRT